MTESVRDSIQAAWSEKSTPATDTPAADAPATVAADEWDAPTDWAHEEREAFRSFPQDARKFALNRFKAVDDGWKTKVTDYEKFQNDYKPIHEFLTPRQQQLQAMGLTPAQAIQQLFGFNDHAGRDPKGFAKWFLESRKLDPREVFGLQQQQADPNAYVDPEVAELRAQIQSLKQGVQETQQQFEQRQRAEQAQRDAAWQKEIADFRDAKGPDKQPKAPYFAEVEADMAALLKTGRASGIADAYTKACRLNDSVHSKVLADQKASERREEELKAKAHAEKAKLAAAPVASGSGSREGPSSQKPKKGESVMSSIKEAYAELQSRNA